VVGLRSTPRIDEMSSVIGQVGSGLAPSPFSDISDTQLVTPHGPTIKFVLVPRKRMHWSDF